MANNQCEQRRRQRWCQKKREEREEKIEHLKKFDKLWTSQHTINRIARRLGIT